MCRASLSQGLKGLANLMFMARLLAFRMAMAAFVGLLLLFMPSTAARLIFLNTSEGADLLRCSSGPANNESNKVCHACCAANSKGIQMKSG